MESYQRKPKITSIYSIIIIISYYGTLCNGAPVFKKLNKFYNNFINQNIDKLFLLVPTLEKTILFNDLLYSFK